MGTITISFDKNYENILEELSIMASLDPTPILKHIGREAIDKDIYDAFELGKDPVTNEKWKPSKRAIDQHGQTLVDTNRLRKSIAYKIEDSEKVTIGTNVIYAGNHQYGIKTIKRRFLGVGHDFEKRILNSSVVKRSLRME